MTEEQLIAMLENLGIIVTGQPGNYELELAKLAGITFINEDTNKAFDISVDAYGNLRSTPVPSNLLKDRTSRVTLSDTKYRGFISKLRIAEKVKADPSQSVSSLEGKDVGLLSDRLKIGAIYAPKPDRTTYGCSHAYVELENTSDQDITLNGCYLHVAVPVN